MAGMVLTQQHTGRVRSLLLGKNDGLNLQSKRVRDTGFESATLPCKINASSVTDSLPFRRIQCMDRNHQHNANLASELQVFSGRHGVPLPSEGEGHARSTCVVKTFPTQRSG